MRTIPDFIETLLQHGIKVELTLLGFQIDGFYKSGNVKLVQWLDTEDWVAHARYDEKVTISSLEDLVSLNYQWWCRSSSRAPQWQQPDSNWAALLEEFGYVKRISCSAG